MFFRPGKSLLKFSVWCRYTTPPAAQKGAVTLVMARILLILTSMVSAYTGSAVLFESKISANEFRSGQAFEAAESGLADSLAYMGTRGGADKNGDGAIDPMFDTDGNGVGDTNTATFADNSSVTVTVTGTFPNYIVQSVGVSDDQTATRTVWGVGASVDALPNSPDNPMTTRGTLIVGGAATVHNPEGASTIWSGNDVDLGSNNATATNIADPADAGYPSCMDTSMTCGTTRSSSKVAVGLDVIMNDSSLANLTDAQMFQNFFGTSMANYRDSRVTLEVAAANANNLSTDSANPGVHLGAGEVIWVEGDTNLENTTTIGCEVPVIGAGTCPVGNLDPTILIINGNLVTNGTPTFYGVVYVIGNMTLGGNNTVHGAMVVGGQAESGAGASLDIWYNSDVLTRSRDNGPLAGNPGSWRDW
jgi:Tfp pilus assembly protein PilX